MTDSAIEYTAVFQALPGMVALLTTEFVYADVNEEFVRVSGRSREQLIGHYLFDVFPDNPNDPAATGMRNLEASLYRVLATGERDTMALQRYDVEDPERPGEWEERYWSPVNAPLLGPDGKVALILHRVEEVTELIRARGRSGETGAAGPGSWKPSSTPAPVSCRSSTTGCARRTPGSGRWRWPCRRQCCPRPGRSATTGPPSGTAPPWVRSTCAGTGTTWSIWWAATVSAWPWAMWSGTGWRPPVSWASCAARSARPPGSLKGPPRRWTYWGAMPT